MQHLSRYVSGLLFFGILACLFIPASAESVSFGYQADPIHFFETANSYILNNSELEIEFFKDTLGYNQYRNTRNGSVLIYDARIWVDYLGPGNKWKTAGIPQTTSYQQIYKGYEITRHYIGIQADYDVVYTWIENRPIKYTVYITAGVEDDFQVAWSLDGVAGTSKIETKSVYAGDNYNLIISIQDVIKSFGDDSIVVTESISANGKKFDYTFGSWELNFLDMVNGSHKIQVDPSIEFNSTNDWLGTSGTMIINPNNGTLENDLETNGYTSRFDEKNGTSTTIWYDWNTTSANDGTLEGSSIFNNSCGVDLTPNAGINLGNGLDFVTSDTYTFIFQSRNYNDGILYHYYLNRGGITGATGYLIQTSAGVPQIFGSGGAAWITSTISDTRDNTNHWVSFTWDGTRTKIYDGKILNKNVSTNGSIKTAVGNTYLGSTTAGTQNINGTICKAYIFKNIVLTNSQINSTIDGNHSITSYRQIDTAQDAGANQVHKYAEVLGTDPSANTSLSLWINGSDDNSSFSGWVEVNSSFDAGDNVTIGIAYEYRYARFRVYSNTTYQSETNIISNITITSAVALLLSPQNLTNITEQTQICYNWDDYIKADKWNISQRIQSIPYTDVKIILDGVKDAEFTDRAHSWVMDSPNPTGTNGDEELISWIRNSTTLSGYADGEDNDALNNDDSFTIMLDMTANNLSTDDRQFILSESGTVTAKRWSGAAWLPQATNAAGVVIGAGVVGDIQYEMQIPISELTNFNNGSTIKLAMAREDTSQNPDVTKYYPKTLINDTDATIWTSINLSAECEFTFLGNTTLSNYTVTGLTPFTWYRHRFSTINGSTESSYVYSNDITEDLPQYIVSGYILTESGLPISGAFVWSVCDCGCVCEVNISNATGYYQGDCFYNGTYTIYASKTDYDTNSTSIIVNGANKSNVNITLSLSPVNGWTSIVDSVAWGISVAQYLVSNIGIVITTAFSLICILILAMLVGAALSVTKLIYR